jgi:uncharacterized membrane protein YfcA
MFGVPVGELAVLALAIAGGGVLTGVLAGLFGIGGGGVIVPVLYEVFRALGVSEEIRMQLCIGTSLAIIVPTTFRSYFTHRAEGIGLHGVVRLWTIPAIVGVVSGAALAAVAPGAVFKVAFAVIAATIAIKLLFGSDRWQLGKSLPGRGPMLFYGFLDDRFHEIGIHGTGNMFADSSFCGWLNEEWHHGKMAAGGRVGDERGGD